MIVKIAAFVKGKLKIFFGVGIVALAVFVAYLIKPGLFVTNFIGWICLGVVVLDAAAIILAYVKGEQL
jgi:uncharacterized membrane protein